jgi:putative proteasome-type protease
MTYCVGTLLQDGVVLLSDSRTNAGIDHVASFRKMTVWRVADERMIALLSAGNLSVTQSVIHHLEEGLETDDGKSVRRMTDVRSMFEAAELVGRAVRRVHAVHGKALEADSGIGFNVSFLLGGQIMGRPPALFQVYAQGNFIGATRETPYLQIGETKYGKPILDRALTYETELKHAAKLVLVSMDSTLRSNLSVGLPLDLLVIRRDTFTPLIERHIDDHDPYFAELRTGWSTALREAFKRMPEVPW